MTTKDWRVWCVNEFSWIPTSSAIKPVACPNDEGHQIRSVQDITPEPVNMSLSNTSTPGTQTNLVMTQTTNRTITLPDADTILIGKDTSDILSNKILNVPQINDNTNIHQYVFATNSLSADRNIILPQLLASDTFVFENHPQTLTYKQLVSPEVSSKLVLKTASNNLNITSSSQSSNVNLNIPNLSGVDDNFVITNLSQTLTNKQLGSTSISSSSIHKYVIGTSELSADRNITLPLLTTDDIFLFQNHTQTLTNKTLTSTTNNISCNSLKTSTGIVNVSGSSAPSVANLLIATGSTSATWQPASSSLLGLGQTSVISDKKSAGSNGGTFTSNAWRTRDLNTLTGNITGISLSSNQITLPTGSYYINITLPAFRVNSHQGRLRNITDNSTEEVGTSSFNSSASFFSIASDSNSIIRCYISINATKIFEVQHQCQTSRTNDGFGIAAGFGTEIYTSMVIVKL